MTNYERIKQISLEEAEKVLRMLVIAENCLNTGADSCIGCVFASLCELDSVDDVKDWLTSEVNNKAN